MSRDPLNRESYASDAVDADEFDNLDAVNDDHYGKSLFVLMTELPDLDHLAVGSLQLFTGVDEPFSVFRSPRHSISVS